MKDLHADKSNLFMVQFLLYFPTLFMKYLILLKYVDAHVHMVCEFFSGLGSFP